MLAAFAAGFVLTYGFDGAPPIEFWGGYRDGYWHDYVGAGFVFGMSARAAAVGFFPAIVAIVVGEAFALSSVFYWLAAGGIIAMLPYLAPGPWRWSDPPDGLMVLYAAAGFAAALVYWLVAGRLAGRGLRRVPPSGSA